MLNASCPISHPRTVVLDVDETLVHSWENPNFLNTLQVYTDPVMKEALYMGEENSVYSMILSDGVNTNMCWGLKRPYLKEFINDVGRFYNILVWSAGSKDYVDSIIEQIVRESNIPYPRVVWTRDKCMTIGGNYHKPLQVLKNHLDTIPCAVEIDLDRTFMVDDKIYTFYANPDNGILIPPYNPPPTREGLLDRTDTELLKLRDWLLQPHVLYAPDVKELYKDDIFK